MIWFLVVIFCLSVILGYLNVPISIVYISFIPIFLFWLYRSFQPILFEKNPDKILRFLKKSKSPQWQFAYHLYSGHTDEAYKTLSNIKSKHVVNINKILLLTNDKKYSEAKALLPQVKENVHKWYYAAIIALHEEDGKTFDAYKEKITDPILRSWLEIEELSHNDQKSEALARLKEQIPKLKGLKLLSALHYKKEISEELH